MLLDKQKNTFNTTVN